MQRVYHPGPQINLKPFGISRARSAHATAETVVRRGRHLMAVESGVRNVAEDPAEFIVSQGRRVFAGLDAPASAINALHRHASAAERDERPTWQERRRAA